MRYILTLVFIITFSSFSIGTILGSQMQVHGIASECKKLGGFYAGDEVFECKLKGEN